MKKVLSIIFTLFLFSSVNAEDISKKVSEYVSNLIPGEGDTEVSIDLRENYEPDYSILAVREISKTDNGNLFTQFSLFNTCLLYTSPSPRDVEESRMPSSA